MPTRWTPITMTCSRRWPVRPERIDTTTAIAIHNMQIDRHGGLPGIRDMGALEACLAQPWGRFGGVDFYPSLEEKAARLAYEVITQHPFADGNKRTGLALMLVLLRAGGSPAVFDHGELYRVTLAVASGDMDYQGLLAFIRSSSSQ